MNFSRISYSWGEIEFSGSLSKRCLQYISNDRYRISDNLEVINSKCLQFVFNWICWLYCSKVNVYQVIYFTVCLINSYFMNVQNNRNSFSYKYFKYFWIIVKIKLSYLWLWHPGIGMKIYQTLYGDRLNILFYKIDWQTNSQI